ncbi:MAG TPA: hypothetical protein PKE16_16450 [Hyphomicrobium sp.]|nr:hypothetical protein [Hyphomicrobium sp.]
MQSHCDLSNVPAVSASDLAFVIQIMVGRGQGLALLRGLHESEIRQIEDEIWKTFRGESVARLAVALRFRALVQVFAHRRLKALFLNRGFRLLAHAAHEAARQPLNVRFGFNAQRLLLALENRTAHSPTLIDDHALPRAA